MTSLSQLSTEKKPQNEVFIDMINGLFDKLDNLDSNLARNTNDLREMQRKRKPLLTGDYKKVL